jgi:phosphoglycerate dehydrogenase-like enzyme
LLADGSARLRHATPDELGSALHGADGLLVWDFTRGDALRTAWTQADRLRWVHTASAGVDRLIFDEMVASDVVLTNSRGVFDTAMAEYVLGAVLAFAKDLPTTLQLQARGEWCHRETETIAGRTAVVVGSGPIGRACTALLAAVGMRVRLVGRRAGSGVLAAGELTALLPDTDYLVLAAPLTEQTRGMVDAALRGGQLAGAALDVFETEPLPVGSPLWALPGVIVSPHMSGDVVGWRDALVELFTDNLDRFRTGRPLRNVVDKTQGYVTAGNP